MVLHKGMTIGGENFKHFFGEFSPTKILGKIFTHFDSLCIFFQRGGWQKTTNLMMI